MSVLKGLAFYRNRRDEAPNKLLAARLARKKDRAGINEIAENLWNPIGAVRSDCLKVLYEVAAVKPELVADYAGDFLELLVSDSNRMVWGAMIGLAHTAGLRPSQVWNKINTVIKAAETGTLITSVWGVKTLAKVAAADRAYSRAITPRLARFLKTCVPRDVPVHLENMMPAVNGANKKRLVRAAESRRKAMLPSQIKRLDRIVKKIGRIPAG